MKVNMPVTDREVKLQDGQELVTKTDLKGIITYANPAFVTISGFSEAELLGKNHNVVRHPDMPPEAFKDLWETMALGRPWSKLVKNRTKTGDYYWVDAHVTPIFQNGRVIEYMSVRTRPTDQQIREAEQLYARIQNKSASIPAPTSIMASTLSKALFSSATLSVILMLVITGFLFATDVSPEWLMLGPVVGFISFLFGAFSCLNDQVLKPLSTLTDEIKAVAEGHYLNAIDVEQAGEIGNARRALKSLAIRMGFEVNDAREGTRNATRIKEALDNVSSNVMMADLHGRIIYMNPAVLGMMQRAEKDIQKGLPDFQADKLLGSDIDSFHKDPSHQRRLLDALRDTYRSKISVGGRSFSLVANPVVEESGARLGTVVEWSDITDQLIAEKEVEDLIRQASLGELSQRLDIDLYEGFMKNIAIGINQMLDTVVAPISEVKRVLQALSDGDLRQNMEGQFHGEFAELNEALNSSLSKLSEMVTDIHGAGQSITTGATEIAHGNATLSQRTESQAASLQETAASMEEMTSTVKQNAENSVHASQLAAEAKDLAEEGSQISERVVHSMNEISHSSGKIAEIIGVIDEIAFQTNLLALNAAVEAARAGEQGRGFAVVASEVRNLAQRSASAAKEIKELISDSVEKVEEGSRYVDESGKALNNIMRAVDKVSGIIKEIASASQEQATGIGQVNTAVSQMDEGTQQNAALVEQVAAASESMEEQAQQLQNLVSFFKVGTLGHSEGHSINGSKTISHVAKPKVASKPAKASIPKSKPIKSANEADDDWEEF